MNEFSRLYENVKQNLLFFELYTVPDLAMISLKLYQMQHGVHQDMPKLSEFAWPYVAFLHETGLYSKPFAHKRNDQQASFYPAWKGYQWLTGEKKAERPWFIRSIIPPLESSTRPVEKLTVEDLPNLIGLYDLLNLSQKTEFPFSAIARKWIKKHPYPDLCHEFGLRMMVNRLYGFFPTFNLKIRDALTAFINTKNEKASLHLLLHGTGIYWLHGFYRYLTVNPQHLAGLLQFSERSRWNRGIWRDLHSQKLLIDLEVFRRFYPELIKVEEGGRNDA